MSDGSFGDGCITQDPEVLGGKPVIRGMRVPASLIADFVLAGDTIEDVLDSYPALTREDVEAALAYAALKAPRPGRS